MAERAADLARQAHRALEDAVAAARRETWAEAAAVLRAAIEVGRVDYALRAFDQQAVERTGNGGDRG